MYKEKKGTWVADAAAAFVILMLSFLAPSIFLFRLEGEWQSAPDGRAAVPWSKDKLPAVQFKCFEHQSLPLQQ